MGRRKIRKTPAERIPLTAPKSEGYWQAFADSANNPKGSIVGSIQFDEVAEYARMDTEITEPTFNRLNQPALVNLVRGKPTGIFTPKLVACFFHAPERREIVRAESYEEALRIAKPSNPDKLDLHIRWRIYKRLGRMTIPQRAAYLYTRDPRMWMMEALIQDGGKWSGLKSRANTVLGTMDGSEAIGSRERAANLEPFFTIVHEFINQYDALCSTETGWWNGGTPLIDVNGPIRLVLDDPAVTAAPNQFRSDWELGALVRVLLLGMGILYVHRLKDLGQTEFPRGKPRLEYVREFAAKYAQAGRILFLEYLNPRKAVKGSIGRELDRRQDELRELWIPRYLTGDFVTPDSEVKRAG